MIYPSRGLVIESISITDENNDRYNVLQQGEDFYVTLRCHAEEEIHNLELACSLTDKSGQLISGQRYPEHGKSIPLTKAGTSFSCKFTFVCKLQAGLYFLNAGAWNCPERIYLHRIVDGAALRIVHSPDKNYGFGLVNLTKTSPEFR